MLRIVTAMKKPATKRKGLNSTLNTSSTLNRSISTYGKVQIRYLQDIPCSNWLPSDDSMRDEKKKDIFSDTSDSFSTAKTAVPSVKIDRNNLFDSDSDDDDFKFPVKKKRRCLIEKQNTGSKKISKPKPKTKTVKKVKESVKKVPKPKKYGTENNRLEDRVVNQFIESAKAKMSSSTEHKKPSSKKTSNKLLTGDKKHQPTQANDKPIDVVNINKHALEIEPVVATAVSEVNNQSIDMFTNIAVIPDTNAKETYLATPNLSVSESKLTTQSKSFTGNQKSVFLKSILKDSSNSDNKSGLSLGNNDTSCNKQSVSFNSTVMYHAANIEMDDENILLPTKEQVFNLGNGQPIMAQSTPLTNNPVGGLMGARIHREIEHNQKLSDLPNEPLATAGKSTLKLNKKPVNSTVSNILNDLNMIPNALPMKKIPSKRVQTKRKPKKVPVWKKNGGTSFCKKSKIIGKSDNDSIHHQIMIGGSVDPKYNFLDNSDDAYFVNSKCEDSIRVKLNQSKPAMKNSFSLKSNKKLKNIKGSDCSQSMKKKKTSKLEPCKSGSSNMSNIILPTKTTARNRKKLTKRKTVLESSVLHQNDKIEVQCRTSGKQGSSHVAIGFSKQRSNQPYRRSTRNKMRINYKSLINGSSIAASSIPLLEESVSPTESPPTPLKENSVITPAEAPTNTNFEHEINSTFETQQARTDLALSKSSSLFSSFNGSESSTENSNTNIDLTTTSTCIANNVESTEKGSCVFNEPQELPKRNRRNIERLNYKELSNFAISVSKTNKQASKTIFSNSPEIIENVQRIPSNVCSNNNFSQTDTNVSKDNSFSSEKVKQSLPVSNNFICDRRRVQKRKGIKAILVISSDNSSLFSTLNRSADKQTTSMTVPMHAFSTINKGFSDDDDDHGELLSDDENVNANAGAAKRMSTPIVSRSPGRQSLKLYDSPLVDLPTNGNKHRKAQCSVEDISPQPATTPTSLAENSKMSAFSPIPINSSPEFSSMGSSNDSPPIAIPEPTPRVTHPRVSCLRHQSTPNAVVTSRKRETDRNKLGKTSHKSFVGVKNSAEGHIRTPHRARSPGSHLSSSIVKIDSRYQTISENRRRTLDSVKFDLTSLISESNTCEENQTREEKSSLIKTRSKSSLPASNLQVFLTPMRKSFVQHITSSGGSMRLKSLGFVDALTPKRAISNDGRILTAREKVLYECDQNEPISFEDALHGVIIESCVKLGEGLYGEVFRCNYENRIDSVAIKIVPIEGSLIVNNEKQKTFEEILPEIISSKELHALREGDENATKGFIELYKVTCVNGRYPEFLLDAWDVFDEERTSENDKPDKFADDQLYLIFQYADGGTDVEHFNFRSAGQAYSVLQQVCAALAVAEKSLQFEHRDLHWGNILVTNTTDKTLFTFIDSEVFKIKTNGVRASIIDFTLSRLSKGGVTVFQNLAADPDLFALNSEEDYQFEIYRMMKKATKNNWSKFQPKNNIFWLHYLNDKFFKEINYKCKKSKVHRSNFAKLKKLDAEILQFKSCLDALSSSILFDENS